MAEIEPIESSKKTLTGSNNAATGQKNDAAGKSTPAYINTTVNAQTNPKLDAYISAKDSHGSNMLSSMAFDDKFNARTAITPPGELVNPYNDIESKMKQGFWARFINIMDKLAAIYGEREKDIREKLSDTFKMLEVRIYSLLEKVDASFEQKDHHKERQTREQERKEFENSQRIDDTLA